MAAPTPVRRWMAAVAGRSVLLAAVAAMPVTAFSAVQTFQEGVSGYSGTADTELDQAQPATNKGAATEVRVDAIAANVQQGLIRFDNVFGAGPGQMPLGATINSAQLDFYIHNDADFATVIDLHRMLVAWTESSTWNSLTNAVQLDDAEALSTPDDTWSAGDADGTGWKTLDVTSTVQTWSAGATVHGWVMVSDDDNNGLHWWTSEYGTAGLRPILTIDYTVAGSGCTDGNNGRDEFNAVAYNGSDGSVDWSGTPWVEVNDDNDPTFIATQAIGIQAGELWVRRASGGDTYIYRELDLSAATEATFSFDYYTTNNLESNDELWVEVSGNGGGSWNRLETFLDDSSGSRAYDITGYRAADTQVRFYARNSLVSGEYFIFDNVEIACSPGVPAYSISGRVFEDADFAGAASDWDGGVGDAPLPNVDVELYDNADSYLASVTTDGAGLYSFAGVGDGSYKVRVRSATIGDTDTPPAAGLNATVPATWPYPLAEMTWAHGAARIGGQDAALDDTATGDNAGPGDTYSTVNISGADLADVNLGFSFDLIVNSRDDTNNDTVRSAQGALRQFIKNGNAIAGLNTSYFAIPVTDPGYTASPLHYTIMPLDWLPTIIDPIALDGTLQPGFPGTPIIELEGSNAGAAARGLNLEAGSDGSIIRGIVINRFDAAGLRVFNSSGNTIQGNYIGVDPTGTSTTVGNAGNGIQLRDGAANNTIGGIGASARNVLSGNGGTGVSIRGAGTDDNLVEGNYIGTDVTGTLDVGNAARGVMIQLSATGNTIGGAVAGSENIIAFNGEDGVRILTSATDNPILRNAIHSNTLLGIDLWPQGVDPNDGGDADSGPNDLLNYPVITSAIESGGNITVNFNLDVPAGGYRIEFFQNPSGADPSGNGEGESYADSVNVNHPGGGLQGFSHAFPGSVGDVITATATGCTDAFICATFGSTSEFGASVTATLASNVVVVNSTGDATDDNPGDGLCDTGGNNSQGATECTLRAAIQEANASALVNTIHFNLPATEAGYVAGPNYWSIGPGSQLPLVSTTMTIDGSTQPTWTSTPVVEVDGTSAGAFADGLRILGDNSTVRSLAINRFRADGIEVATGASGTTIAGNHIGLDPTGLVDRGNARGIDLASGSGPTTVGGVLPADRNVISGNGGDGIIVWDSDGNTIIGK